jgi:hypothetical protein
MSMFSDLQPDITWKNILTRYEEDYLYNFYCPSFTLGDIKSPFRHEDSPSFGFYEAKNGRILWKDSGKGDAGGIVKFIVRIYRETKGFKGTDAELLVRAWQDLQEEEISFTPSKATQLRNSTQQKRKQVQLEAVLTKERIVPPVFMRFWEQWGISQNYLTMYDTFFAEEVWLYKTVDGQQTSFLWGRSTMDNPIFVYTFDSGHLKAYRPFETERRRKWIMNCNNVTDVQGLKQCDIMHRRPRLLVITKSMKDVIFLRTMGIDAIAFHGESHTGTISVDFINYLKKYCGFIISLYDNDIPGIRGGIYLRDTFGIPMFFYPTHLGAKDSTDVYLKVGTPRYYILVELLNEILKRDYSNQYTGVGPSIIQGLRTAC